MKKSFKNIGIIILGLIILIIIIYYGYSKYVNLLNFNIKEKLVVKFNNDDNKYLVDLNNYNGNKLQLNLKVNNYNGNYEQIIQYDWEKYIDNKFYSPNNKIYITKGKLYKDNKLYLDSLFSGTGIKYFSIDNKYFIDEIFPEPKCLNCNYLVILNIEDKRKRKLKIYDENGNELYIKTILGYVLE